MPRLSEAQRRKKANMINVGARRHAIERIRTHLERKAAGQDSVFEATPSSDNHAILHSTSQFKEIEPDVEYITAMLSVVESMPSPGLSTARQDLASARERLASLLSQVDRVLALPAPAEPTETAAPEDPSVAHDDTALSSQE
ncbi:hypothetical protein EXIGLDRAFT_719292 [Exidia glandulosa HHB12029]|uniref:Uncharacterized protein n=1 Tax=Exidia glandulosa HHB12029 TaxID=1314781 RepID=A0A165H5W2_EXIGL|nr:hypothetical protein EXIGLDRAFT_719292 [Exidia glandulosa HHB12029]